MAAGHYDKRVTIQVATVTRDDRGQQVYSWADLASRWASIVDAGGRELYRAQQVSAEITAVVQLREQYAGLAPEHRIIYRGRIFNINAVLGGSDRTAKRGQVVHCVEEVGGA